MVMVHSVRGRIILGSPRQMLKKGHRRRHKEAEHYTVEE